MKLLNIKRFSILSIALTSLALFACSGIGTSNKAQLRVGISADYPPLAYKEDGNIVGIEADLAQELANRLDRNLVLVDMPWGKPLVEHLDNNDIDVVMAGVTITEEREKIVDFTQPYLRVGQMAITRTEIVTMFPDKQALLRTDATVGVIDMTTGQHFAKAQLKSADIKNYKQMAEAIQALKLAEVDVLILDAPAVWLETDGRHPGLIGLYWPLTEEYLGWAVKSGNGILKQTLNDELEALKASGELYSIINKNIKVRITVD